MCTTFGSNAVQAPDALSRNGSDIADAEPNDSAPGSVNGNPDADGRRAHSQRADRSGGAGPG
jgi:hypothetical protein